MAAKKITCPVCMTKMQNVGHDLVCPVCGYKYCGNQPYIYDDHNHNEYRSYSQKTSYSGGYQTSSQSGQTNAQRPQSSYQGGQTNAQRPQSSYQSGQTNAPRPQSSYQSGQANAPRPQSSYQSQPGAPRPQAPAPRPQSSPKPKKKGVGKLVFWIILVYFLAGIIGGLAQEWERHHLDFSDILEMFQDSAHSSFYPRENDETSSPEPEKTVDFTVLDPFGLQDPSHPDNTFLQQFVCATFDKEISLINAKDCAQVKRMDFYLDGEQDMTVDFFLSDGSYGHFTAPLETFDTSEFRAFYELEMLDLSKVDFLPLEPGDLDGLGRLTSLGCSNSPKELAEILSPRQLTFLIISLPNASLSLEGVEDFANLRVFSAKAGQLTQTEGIAQLKDLYNLTLADLGYLSDFTFIASLQQLMHLDLCCPGLSDIGFLSGTPSMTELILADTDQLQDLSPLAQCPKLNYLHLTNLTNLTDFGPIGKCERLTQLTLNYCGLRDLAFAGDLENLKILAIIGNEVTSLAPLSDLPNLQSVYCVKENITDFGTLDTDNISIY